MSNAETIYCENDWLKWLSYAEIIYCENDSLSYAETIYCKKESLSYAETIYCVNDWECLMQKHYTVKMNGNVSHPYKPTNIQ